MNLRRYPRPPIRRHGWTTKRSPRERRTPATCCLGPHASRIDDDVWQDPPLDSEESPAQAAIDTSELPTMIIGVGLARELDLGEGDVVRLVDPGATFDHSEEPQFVYYLISGVFQAGFQEYDSRLVYIDIKELQRFKYRGKDIVSGVDLRLDDQDLAPEVGTAIRKSLNGELAGEYSVLEWQKLNENLFSSIRTQKNIITIILSLVIFVASFNVLSALWTMVVRRTPEIAIIMSMGAPAPQIAQHLPAHRHDDRPRRLAREGSCIGMVIS